MFQDQLPQADANRRLSERRCRLTSTRFVLLLSQLTGGDLSCLLLLLIAQRVARGGHTRRRPAEEDFREPLDLSKNVAMDADGTLAKAVVHGRRPFPTASTRSGGGSGLVGPLYLAEATEVGGQRAGEGNGRRHTGRRRRRARPFADAAMLRPRRKHGRCMACHHGGGLSRTVAHQQREDDTGDEAWIACRELMKPGRQSRLKSAPATAEVGGPTNVVAVSHLPVLIEGFHFTDERSDCFGSRRTAADDDREKRRQEKPRHQGVADHAVETFANSGVSPRSRWLRFVKGRRAVHVSNPMPYLVERLGDGGLRVK